MLWLKKNDEAFKRQAVEMDLRGGKTAKQAAEDLGVSQYSIYQWKKKFFPLSAPERSQLCAHSHDTGGQTRNGRLSFRFCPPSPFAR